MQSPKLFLGIFLMIMAMFLFASKDGIAKVIVREVNPAELIWIQFTFTFIILAIATARKYGLRALKPSPLGLQVMRGTASFGGIGCFYWTLQYIPIADATAMVLIAPIVVTALSPCLLHEKIGVYRTCAVLVGFVGVLIILRPGFRGDIEGYLIGLLTGVLYGFNYIGNRRLGGLHPPLVNIAYNVLPGVVLLAPVMLFVWETPPAMLLNFSLPAFLVIAFVAHCCMISAFLFAPASVIAPYQYTVIVFASIIGYVFFATFPDFATWIGIALIVAAGILIALREAQNAKHSKTKV